MLRLPLALLFFPLRLVLFLYYRLSLLRSRSIVHLTVPDRFTLFESSGWMARFVGQARQGVSYFPFLFLLRRIRKARGIKQLILEIPPGFESALNWSQIFDIAAELDRIREAGIRIVGHASGGGLHTLLLLSRADLRLLGPSANFMVALPHAESFFYAGLLDQLGLKVEIYHAGKYKSAGESFSRTGSSAPARENLSALLTRMRALILERLEHTPALDMSAFARLKKLLLNQSICSGQDLLDTSFVNAILEAQYLKSYLATGTYIEEELSHAFHGPGDASATTGNAGTGSLADLVHFERQSMSTSQFLKRESRRNYRPLRFRRPPSIALAVLHGVIVNGKVGDSARAGNVVAHAWYDLFRELEEGPDRAIFLYVDSPGGLSDASELLFQQIRRLSRKKPVIAYFGGVAASGGYYLACAANRIYSSPVSLTGSIGVIRFRPQISGLMRKLRINSERTLFDETTDLLSATAKPGRRSRKLLEESTADTYTEFLKRVSEGRGMPMDQVMAAAGGRVYVADEIRESGLIDGTADFLDLLDQFKKEAGFSEDTALEVRLLPELQLDLRALLRSGLPLAGQSIAALQRLFPTVSAEALSAVANSVPVFFSHVLSPFLRHDPASSRLQGAGRRSRLMQYFLRRHLY